MMREMSLPVQESFRKRKRFVFLYFRDFPRNRKLLLKSREDQFKRRRRN